MRRGTSEAALQAAERKFLGRASFELAEDEIEALRDQFRQSNFDTAPSRLHADVTSLARQQNARDTEFSDWKVHPMLDAAGPSKIASNPPTVPPLPVLTACGPRVLYFSDPTCTPLRAIMVDKFFCQATLPPASISTA